MFIYFNKHNSEIKQQYGEKEKDKTEVPYFFL